MFVLDKLFGKRNKPPTFNIEISSGFSAFRGSGYDNATFRAAVDTIARHTAKLHAHCPVTQTLCAAPTLEQLLAISPNVRTSAYDALYRLATAYFVNNNAFMSIQREGETITAFYNLSPSSVEFFSEGTDTLFVKMTFTDGRQTILNYNDVIHIRRHYSNNELLGADNAPLNSLLNTAETLNQGIAAATKNAVNLKGVLKFTSLVNPAQQKIEKDTFIKDFYNTDNNGGLATTDQRYEFQPVNNTPYSVPRDAIDAVNSQIYAYLGISPKIVNGEFTENEFQGFYESIIEPLALQMSLEFTRKCRADIQFTSERLEFSSAKTRVSLIHTAAPLGILTVNECRKLLALPPIDGGEKTLQSLNYVNAAKADLYQKVENEVEK